MPARCFVRIFIHIIPDTEHRSPSPGFQWDPEKEALNIQNHGVTFSQAELAFRDEKRVIAKDITHSTEREVRYYCFARVGAGILTVRFTYRTGQIRIFGAGYWRKGKKTYEQQDRVHRG